MPRTPKGVVTRSQPEWNSANLYWGGFALASTGTAGQYTGLILSNTSQGQSLVVWDWEIACANPISGSPALPFEAVFCWDSKPFAHTTYSPAVGIAPHQLGTIPVAQWGTYSFTGGPSGLTQFVLAPLQLGYWKWKHEWPMVTVPPGYCIGMFVSSLNTVYSSQFPVMTCLFEAVNNPYP